MPRKQPPKLRVSHTGKTCHNCKSMNKHTGQCMLYNYPVTRKETCDSWAERKK